MKGGWIDGWILGEGKRGEEEERVMIVGKWKRKEKSVGGTGGEAGGLEEI